MISPSLAHSPGLLAPERLPQHVPLAAQTRGGLVESVHFGSAIATAADGRTLLAAGEPLALRP
jgi:L-asparaginase II